MAFYCHLTYVSQTYCYIQRLMKLRAITDKIKKMSMPITHMFLLLIKYVSMSLPNSGTPRCHGVLYNFTLQSTYTKQVIKPLSAYIIQIDHFPCDKKICLKSGQYNQYMAVNNLVLPADHISFFLNIVLNERLMLDLWNLLRSTSSLLTSQQHDINFYQNVITLVISNTLTSVKIHQVAIYMCDCFITNHCLYTVLTLLSK